MLLLRDLVEIMAKIRVRSREDILRLLDLDDSDADEDNDADSDFEMDSSCEEEDDVCVANVPSTSGSGNIHGSNPKSISKCDWAWQHGG